MTPLLSYIKVRKDFPAIPQFSLPIYPRSEGVDSFAPNACETRDGANKDFVQLNWVLAGCGTMYAGGKPQQVRPGDVIIQYPGEPRHNQIGPAGLKVRWLTFDGSQAANFMRSYGYNELLHAGSANLEVFFSQFQAGLDELTSGGLRRAVSAVTALLAELGENLPDDHPEPALVRQFRQAAEHFYGDPTTDVNMLCAYLQVHRGTISRIFKSAGLGTPGNCLREIRVRHALELLAIGTSVGETARRCGFPEASYFSQAIRRITGLTPRNFQRFK